jgi:GT2 family glycosyltransferase
MYVRAALGHSAGAERLILSYERALDDPERTLERLAALVGRPKLARKPEIRAAADDFIERELRHHHCPLVDTTDNGELAFQTKALYLALVLQERLALTSTGAESLLEGVLEPFADSAVTSRLACEALEAAATEAERCAADQGEELERLRRELVDHAAASAARQVELDSAREDLAAQIATLASGEADRERELIALRAELEARGQAAARAEAEAVRDRESLRAELDTRDRAVADQEVGLTKLRQDLRAAEEAAVEQGRALAAAHVELAARETEIAELVARSAPAPFPAPNPPRRTSTARPGALRCSIVIPVFNKASLTKRCLDALLNDSRERVGFEVIVVDDASTDATSELLTGYGDRLRMVTHAANSGFAVACNTGAAAGSGEYVVFLNNDTLPEPGWLDALVAYADAHEFAAAVGSKLLFPNGTVQHAGVAICQDGFPRHIYAGFPADHPAVSRSKRFQVVTGACMLVRRSSFDDIGGFDAAFRNGYEDVDLCLRLSERGFETHYCHESVLVHLESVSRQIPTSGQLPRHEIEHNTKLYADRWLDRVQPDDLNHYLEDGLVRLGYSEIYPLQMTISPELAVLLEGEHEAAADRLLRTRSHQFYELLRDNIRLGVRVAEAEFDAGKGSSNGRADHGRRRQPAVAERVAEGEVHWLSNEPSGRLVSVMLPVKNGADRLRQLLPLVLEQETSDCVELVAVDSGSTDDTVDVLREFGATVISIQASAFNHGLTRNLAADFARGDVFVYLNQSATPADRTWLASLVSALDRDPFVAGACSCVLPRDEADLLTRRDGLRDPSASLERQIRQIEGADRYATLSPHQLRLLVNFHTVSAAIRPEVLARIPFREVLMGEDMLWAKEVLEAGLKIQHEPSSVVFHSHAYSFADVLRRNVDDGFATREIVGRRMADEDVVPTIASLVRDDWRFLAEDCVLDRLELEQWRLDAVMRRSAQIAGQWLGTNRELLSDELFAQLSLTERIRSGASLQQLLPTPAPNGGPTKESP